MAGRTRPWNATSGSALCATPEAVQSRRSATKWRIRMIRMGMIGCGSMAASHGTVAPPLVARMRFTAFADIDIERAQRAAAIAQGAMATTDYRDILEHVDAVIIALPHDLHYSVGMDCLKAGKHVLMEKPLALTEVQCRELMAADKSPTPVLIDARLCHATRPPVEEDGRIHP